MCCIGNRWGEGIQVNNLWEDEMMKIKIMDLRICKWYPCCSGLCSATCVLLLIAKQEIFST